MTQKKLTLSAIQHVRVDAPRVTQHDIIFQLRIVAFNGNKPPVDGPKLYQTLAAVEEALHSQLPRMIQHWRYVDEFQVECDRLELYQIEFGDDDALPSDVILHDVGVYSNGTLPLSRIDASKEHPLCIEQLVEDAPEALIKLYADAGVTVELNRVIFVKKYASSERGEYILK